MKRLYKYEVRLFRLYEVFGDKIFYGRQAHEVLSSSRYIDSTNLTLTGLERKKLLVVPKREEIRSKIDQVDFRKRYRKLSGEGLKIAKYIEDNRKCLTMFMLRG